jgi:probable DNA metabolism protein
MSEILTYTYDGTLEGFLTVVFEAYATHETPDEITSMDALQYRLEQRLVNVQTDDTKWQRVHAGIKRSIGWLAWTKVRACFLATVPDKELLLYRYLVYGFTRGKRIHNDLTHAAVLPVEALYQDVGKETERMRQFARFAKLPSGAYFAKINPKHSVVPLVMDHFANRFNTQSFIIYDEVHQLVGLSEAGRWHLAGTDEFHAPDLATDERAYQRLWKTFYDAVAIPQRTNHKLRRSFMPKRLWANITEMTFVDDTERATLESTHRELQLGG